MSPVATIQIAVRCLLGVAVGLVCLNSLAQDATMPILERPISERHISERTERVETVVRQSPLDVIYLTDRDGNPLFKLPGGWSLQDLDKFYDFVLQEQRSIVPDFVIRNVHATGKVVGPFVEIDARIELSTSSQRAVRVPLGFREGILPSLEQPSVGVSERMPFRYTGSGSAELTVEDGQYVAIVMPKESRETNGIEEPNSRTPDVVDSFDITQRHTLAMILWFPYTQYDKTRHNGTMHSGAEYRLALSFPQANSSLLLFDIPILNAEVSINRGMLLASRENAEQHSTQLTIQGLRSDTEIVWGQKRPEIADDRPVLNVARASINVRLDARNTIYDAELPINSETGSFDQVRIRLPYGSHLDREISDQYAEANDYTIDDADDLSILTVRFPRRTAGPVVLNLRAVQQFEADKPDFTRTLEGFEVLGAERQSGMLTVSVLPAEMDTHWEPNRGIRRAETASPAVPSSAQPTPSASTANIAGARMTGLSGSGTRFEFMSQPFSLRVRAAFPRTLVSVKPEYQFRISRGTISMNARLAYTVSGSKTDNLHIRLDDLQGPNLQEPNPQGPNPQWHYDFSVSNHVEASRVELDSTGLLSIPLRTPMEGSFEIDFQSRRSIPSDEEAMHRIAVPIPKPQVSWSESASIMIIPDNNVEIRPIDEANPAPAEQQTRGLSRQTRRTTSLSLMRHDLTELQQEPLFYRTERDDAEFVADVIFRRQRLAASMQSEIRLVEEIDSAVHSMNVPAEFVPAKRLFFDITQHINYNAEFAPVDRLFLILPRSLELHGNVQVSLDNQTLLLRDTLADTGNNIPDNWVQKMVQLPEPRFQLQLTFQYSSPHYFFVPNDTTTSSALSFIMPIDVPVSRHQTHFVIPTDYTIELQHESRTAWEPFRETRQFYAHADDTFRTFSSAAVLSPANTPSAYRQPPGRMALFVAASEKNVADTTIIDRAWLQTWLTGSLRRDLATYRLTTSEDAIAIQLPPGATQEHRVVVLIDQQQVQYQISPTNLLTIPILPEQQNHPIEISIDYRYSFETPFMTVPVVLPSFAHDTSVQYQFWQVILARHQHIIGYPADWTLEYDWAWNGLFWWRVPSIRKSDIGLTPSLIVDEPLASTASQYVFSHIQSPDYATLYIMDRSLIVLGSSAIALFIGLMMIYVPQSRYTGSFFGLAVATAALLIYQPSMTLLMLQAATFGVFLALGAGYVYRILHRQDRWIANAVTHAEYLPQTYLNSASITQTIHEVIVEDESEIKNTDTTTISKEQE